MELEGAVARIRKDRYIIPKDADLFTGTIQFHASGTAHVLNETAGQPDLYISGENTFTAMHGDRVVARIDPARPAPPPRRGETAQPARLEGRVIRILERVNDTVVGTLQKTKNFFYVVADDPRFIHNLYVPAPTIELHADIGDKVVARPSLKSTACPRSFRPRCCARPRGFPRRSIRRKRPGARICAGVLS